MSKINLIIPINGLGNRFKDDGYEIPKPLIRVLGKPMIFWLFDNLDLTKVKDIIIPYTSILDNFNFQSQIRERYKHVNFKFISLNYPTRGAAETVQVAISNLDASDASNIMIMDCDTFYFEDVVDKYVNSSKKNNIFYFEDKNEKPIYSYIKIQNGLVSDIIEKEKISNNANCGIYCFENQDVLRRYCDTLLENGETQKNEFYISGLYKLMLRDNVSIGCNEVKDFHCVGTPLQLKIFCENNKPEKIRRFCFDLDQTLVSKPSIDGDYSSVTPIEKNINFLRYLKSLGHYIMLLTARRMRTHDGNPGKVVKDIGLITLKTLEDFNIPYDEIHFSKPWADFYIDDLAVNCNLDLEKEIGFYNSSIMSRKFNKVEILNNLVIKTGNIDGERFYYSEIQKYDGIKNLFPKMIEQASDKIIIEKIQGINFSYLYTNNNLTENNFKEFLAVIKRIHSIEGDFDDFGMIHDSVKKKVAERYMFYDYSRFNSHKEVYDGIVNFLDEYYSKKRSISIIHGDPVFTNIIITNDNNIKLIDMRGKIGDVYSIFGDPIYDISKIYQSLSGYDFILNNKVDYDRNKNIMNIFEKWVEENYGFTKEEIRKFTAMLYFSLIPLHDDEKCGQYFSMAKKLIQ